MGSHFADNFLQQSDSHTLQVAVYSVAVPATAKRHFKYFHLL